MKQSNTKAELVTWLNQRLIFPPGTLRLGEAAWVEEGKTVFYDSITNVKTQIKKKKMVMPDDTK